MRRGRRSGFTWLGIAALGIGAAALVVHLTRPPTIGDPSPRVQRLLPTVTRYLENTNADRTRRMGARTTWFCGTRYLGNSRVQHRFDVYVWAACQEYGEKAGRLVADEGFSVPTVVRVVEGPDGYRPVSTREPGDGDAYEPSTRRLFPKGAEHFILDRGHDGDSSIQAMFDEVERRARRALLSPR